MLVGLLADVGVVRAVQVRGGHELAVDFVLPDPTVLLVEVPLQDVVSFREAPEGCSAQARSGR